ncbi:hypothetical protein [Actinacidiphila glaucinigra]|uniref:hypothetical protein n=1 Tax=Actinacidiphila glaucinigra TaxID=235986 RepID=UPI003D946BCC
MRSFSPRTAKRAGRPSTATVCTVCPAESRLKADSSCVADALMRTAERIVVEAGR